MASEYSSERERTPSVAYTVIDLRASLERRSPVSMTCPSAARLCLRMSIHERSRGGAAARRIGLPFRYGRSAFGGFLFEEMLEFVLRLVEVALLECLKHLLAVALVMRARLLEEVSRVVNRVLGVAGLDRG